MRATPPWTSAPTVRAIRSASDPLPPRVPCTRGTYPKEVTLLRMPAKYAASAVLAGGFVGGKLFPRVPAPWLRYLFAAFLVYGGIRYLL